MISIEFLKSFFDKIENIKLNWRAVFFLASFVVSIRLILELKMSSSVNQPIWSFIFFASWFLALFLSLSLFVACIGKKDVLKTAKLFLFGLPVILIPLVGLWQGKVKYFTFPQDNWSEILYHLATFLWFHPLYGTYFTIEILIFLIAVFIYLLLSVSLIRAVIGAFGAYGILIFFALYSKTFWLLYSDFAITNLSISRFYTSINLFILLVAGFIIYWLRFPEKAKALIFKLRPNRLVFLLSIAMIMLAGALSAPTFYIFNFLLGFLLFGFFLLHAALLNDLADVKIDKISNPDRPYASGLMSKQEIRRLNYIILGIIISLSFILSSVALILLTFIVIFLSIAYSAFRFRRNFFSFLIPAFGESAAVLYGYFSQNLDHISIPSDILAIFAAFFILLCFFLPVKDLKDFKGDSTDGVRNFLTVFGWRKGKLVIAIMLSSGYLIFSYLTQNPIVIAFSFIFAVLGVFFVIYYEKLGEFPIYLNFLSFTIFISVFLMLS